jgi:hypothetical protein
MGYSRTGHWHFSHIAPGLVGSFSNGFRYLTSFTNTYSHTPIIIANYNHRSEAKSTATFDYLGRAGNMNYTLIKFFYSVIKLSFCHKFSFLNSR